MKAIDLSTKTPSLSAILKLACKENVIIKTVEGREFVLAEIDDFAHEVALVRQNDALMKFLRERSREKSKYSLDQVKQELRVD